MRHAAHKAAKVSHAQFSLSKALFTANRGSHTAKAVRMAQLAEGGAVVGLAPEVVDKLNEVAPMSRRAMREAAKAASRKSALVTSASLAALVGTAATALAFGQQNASRLVLADDGTETSQIKRVSDGAASRSEGRTALKELASTSNNGGWQLGDTSASMDASLMSKSIADNPNVAVLMDQDSSALPANFNPNHATGDVGNAYEFSQCTWWVYVRRHQLVCLQAPTWATVASGPIRPAPWAIGLITRRAMSAISSCSPQARKVPTRITATSPSLRKSTTTARS